MWKTENFVIFASGHIFRWHFLRSLLGCFASLSHSLTLCHVWVMLCLHVLESRSGWEETHTWFTWEMKTWIIFRSFCRRVRCARVNQTNCHVSPHYLLKAVMFMLFQPHTTHDQLSKCHFEQWKKYEVFPEKINILNLGRTFLVRSCHQIYKKLSSSISTIQNKIKLKHHAAAERKALAHNKSVQRHKGITLWWLYQWNYYDPLGKESNLGSVEEALSFLRSITKESGLNPKSFGMSRFIIIAPSCALTLSCSLLDLISFALYNITPMLSWAFLSENCLCFSRI